MLKALRFPFLRVATLAAFGLTLVGLPSFAASRTDETPVIGDMSVAGLRAAASISDDPGQYLQYLPEGSIEAVRNFVNETRSMGLVKRSSVLWLPGPTNIRANNPAGDRIGETQSEISVAVFRDTVVIGWNDSQGFLGAPLTLSSYAYSTNGGATFVDGGNVPLALPTDQSFGDTGWDTDERGNWYLNSIYTRAAGAPGPVAEQDIGVHHARFNGAGVLVLDPPVMASIGTSATGNLDKCLLACDRVTGNVYVAYTRFVGNTQIEIVRSTTLGASWGAPIILDNTTTPTTSKQGARPICGPNGEVYVVWEKGANSILCPDASNNVASYASAQIAFSRSLDFGATFSAYSTISNLITGFLASGPGDLRERANEFPDIAVDVSNGCYRGNLYVTWHTAAPWTANVAAGPASPESGVNNNNPTTPDVVPVGNDATGAISPAGDLDYWQFGAVQGQSYLIDVLPQGFVCGVSGTTRQMRVRLFATTPVFPNPTGFPDSLLAGSFIGSFENRIVWTAPQTGNFLVRLQISGGTTTGTYTLRIRPLAFTPGAARDARDVVVSRSSNQGATWSAPARINDDPAGLENRRPFIATNNSGQVAAFWHDSRDAGFGSSASLTSLYGTVSRDGGASWSPNFSVTDELSFFSFNTLAVPNLGDYNMAAAGGTQVFHPAWSDQRISTGDVRTPGTNTYTAGLGPEAYTTGISFANGIVCPADTLGAPGGVVTRRFRLTNTGTAPDNYNYTITDSQGWIIGAPVGATGILTPGSFFDVFVQVQIPSNCTPSSTVLTLSVLPQGEGCYAPQTCTSTVNCDIATATLIQRFDARPSADGVDIDWASTAVGTVMGWNLYRSSTADGEFVRVNPAMIAMTAEQFHLHDAAAPSGSVYYRLAAVMADGREQTVGTLAVTNTGALQPFAFAISGANPFTTETALTFAVPRETHVSVELFSITGQRVRTLVNGVQNAGVHSVPLDRQGLRSGVYLARISAGRDRKSVMLVALD